MSLYTLEEICKGCIHATFHECCGSFCCCDIGMADDVNGYNCTCEGKEENE